MGGTNSGKPEGYGKQVKIEPVLDLLKNKYLDTEEVSIHFVEEIETFGKDYDFEELKKIFSRYKNVVSWNVTSGTDKTDITFVLK